MGASNLKLALVNKLALLRGEHAEVRAHVVRIRYEHLQLNGLTTKLEKLEAAIANAEGLLKFEDPYFDLRGVLARRPASHRSPIPMGDLGKTALAILRDAPEGMRSRDIARELLRRYDQADADRATLDKISNSVNGYLKKYDGDLVTSDGQYARKWTVIL